MKNYNIVLIVIDACRVDHLSCYGYNKKTSPNIDKLAKDGILFENAFSCTNATDPSITTILSGKYPISHGIRNHGTKVTNFMIQEFYKRNIKYLSEIIKNVGYKTYGIDWLGRWHKKGFEYYFGDVIYKKFSLKLKNYFEKFIQRNKVKIPCTATKLTDISIELINKHSGSGPFLLFIHYWDTHTPYNGQKNIIKSLYSHEFKDEFKESKIKDLIRNISNIEWKNYLLRCFGDATIGEIIAKYDAAIKYVDQEIGRLIDVLKDKGIYDDTIFIITSDHGESLTEHGIFFDHHGLYDVFIHVPLIFSNLPFEVEQTRIENLVQHVDIVPTILDILNIPFNKSEFDGISLIPVMKGEMNISRSFIVVEESYTEKR